MKRIILIILCLIPFFLVKMKAQVTIGSTEKPKDFSILELEGNGSKGLRIPQMTTKERDKITDSDVFKQEMDDEAKGLVIYNKTTKTFQYWNGKLWTEF